MNRNSFTHILAKVLLLVFIVALTGLAAISPRPRPAYGAGPWYVAITGSDSNDCQSPSTPCATINRAIEKAAQGDMIRVMTGVYTVSTGSEVVLINKSVMLSGGWNSTFNTQNGLSTVDATGVRRGIMVTRGIHASIDHFVIQNGYDWYMNGGGLYNNHSTVTVTYSIVARSVLRSGGITNYGVMTISKSLITQNSGCGIGNNPPDIGETDILVLNDSLVSNNIGEWCGGITNDVGVVVINNSTLSGNSNTSLSMGGGGIVNHGGTVLVNSSTVAQNISTVGGGGIDNDLGTVTLQNTILSENKANAASSNCNGTINSGGYNLIGDTSGCTFAPTNGDLANVNPQLGPLRDNGGPTLTHALLPGSPAIDAGNPASPGSGGNACEATDQRGVTRPQGVRCDIGAFELEAPSVIEVLIDIKPGSFSNPINPKDQGKIPVAILSTHDFDAPSKVDKTSLTFGRAGGEQSLAFCNKSAEDINADGRLDLVCHFKTQLTDFRVGDTKGILRGKTVDGVRLEGSDSVRIVP